MPCEHADMCASFDNCQCSRAPAAASLSRKIACAGNTFGKAIAGILAHSKGRSIGIYEDKEKDEEAEKEKAEKEEKQGVKKVDVFNMKVSLSLSVSVL